MRKITALALVVAGAFPLAGCFVGPSASDEAPLAAQEQPQAPLFAADFPDPEKDVSDTELQRAVAVFRSMQRAEPSNHEANIKLGEVYLRLKQPSEAIKQFTSALSASAQEAKAKQGLGLAFLRLGDRDSARRYLTEALSADATLWRANLGLGQLADEARDWNAAEAAYQAALIPRPRAAAHNNLGLSYARQRRYDEAITQFHLALALKAD
ncbi:MAG: tetratricopeptide repeat protein, partial [Alphaproteobacteria bacterium]|nr:tetratricopeptide repeat protein [Alphaproteobacteria bacterium]